MPERKTLIRVCTISNPSRVFIEAKFHEEYLSEINEFVVLYLKKGFAVFCSPDYGEVLAVKHISECSIG